MLGTLEHLELEPLQRLSRDIRKAGIVLAPKEARYLVDLYYQVQEYRKRAANQDRALTASGEPHEITTWVFDNVERLENDIKRALDAYSDSEVPGRWAKSICGIGPVLSAGLLAHIDLSQAPTVGHIWRFAGLDSTNEWLGTEKAKALLKEVLGGAKAVTAEHVAIIGNRIGRRVYAWDSATRSLVTDVSLMTLASLAAGLARRPWNAKLKVLCWKIGESFVKVQNNDADVYGHIYAERKALEIERNEAGAFASQAAGALAQKRYSHDTEAYRAYIAGKLPPAHIHARAKRYAVKFFLSHFHAVSYEAHYGCPPPKPFILTRPAHVHFIAPPNWPPE